MVALLSNGNFHYKWFIFDRTQIQQTKLKIIYSANVSSLSCPWKITWTGIVSTHHRLLLFLSLSESPDNMWKTIVIWEIIPGIQYAVNHHGVCLNTNKLLLTFSLSIPTTSPFTLSPHMGRQNKWEKQRWEVEGGN